jgi:hypothetical protein
LDQQCSLLNNVIEELLLPLQKLVVVYNGYGCYSGLRYLIVMATAAMAPELSDCDGYGCYGTLNYLIMTAMTDATMSISPI